MDRVEFKLSEDQFILLQHLLPKKYVLKKDTTLPKAPSNSAYIHTPSHQFASTFDSNICQDPAKKSNHDLSKQTSNQSVPSNSSAKQRSQPDTDPNFNQQKFISGKQINQSSKELFTMLLDAIEIKQSASIFLEPVDPVKLSIPEYLIVIKKPMDLRTMRTKVNKRRYKSFEDFKQDIDQIVWNCMTFNARNQYFTKIGTNFQRDCKTIFQKHKNKIDDLSHMIETKIKQLKSKNLSLDDSENFRSDKSKLIIKKRKKQQKNSKTQESIHQTEESQDQETQNGRKDRQKRQNLPSKEQMTKQTSRSLSSTSRQKELGACLNQSLESVKRSKFQDQKKAKVSRSSSACESLDKQKQVFQIEKQQTKQIETKISQRKPRSSNSNNKMREVEEQKRSASDTGKEKMLQMLHKIRIMPRNKKDKFYRQLNLVNGKKLNFEDLSAGEFQSIEAKFNEFMRNKSI